MARPLNNVPENNPRIVLSSPPDTNTPMYSPLPSYKDMNKPHNSQEIEVTQKLELILEVSEVPDAEVGGAIVDDDGIGGREEIVISLPLNPRYEWHY